MCGASTCSPRCSLCCSPRRSSRRAGSAAFSRGRSCSSSLRSRRRSPTRCCRRSASSQPIAMRRPSATLTTLRTRSFASIMPASSSPSPPRPRPSRSTPSIPFERDRLSRMFQTHPSARGAGHAPARPRDAAESEAPDRTDPAAELAEGESPPLGGERTDEGLTTRRRERTSRCAPSASSKLIRRRPTLPGALAPSTIGAGGLNFSVRNGKRCTPAAMTAESVKGGTRPPGRRARHLHRRDLASGGTSVARTFKTP